ncbi:MAG: hypothetical protein DIU66_000230 [Bacillota bacterium]
MVWFDAISAKMVKGGRDVVKIYVFKMPKKLGNIVKKILSIFSRETGE